MSLDFVDEDVFYIFHRTFIYFFYVEWNAELSCEPSSETLIVPLGFGGFWREEAVNGVVEAIFHHFQDDLAHLPALEDLVAERVDYLALFVHNGIIFEKVFADVEVVGLDIS